VGISKSRYDIQIFRVFHFGSYEKLINFFGIYYESDLYPHSQRQLELEFI
jgi:hypothetical protein